MSRFSLALIVFMMTTQASAYNGRVVDGDTIKIGNVTHRLHGIDAPEEGQKCNGTGKRDWPCGKQATDEMDRLLRSGEVRCERKGKDGYGRQISICHVGAVNLNEHMVRNGFAWAFAKYSQDYVDAENLAKADQAGIWIRPTQTAWEYRERRWNDASETAPEGCPIKGNISQNGKIYHAPWSPWYKRTKINTKKGERWFCDEAEAVEAGWRAPMWR